MDSSRAPNVTFEPRPEVIRIADALWPSIQVELALPKHAWSLAAAMRRRTGTRIDPEDLEQVLVALQTKGLVRRFKGHGGEPMYELVRLPPRPVRVGIDWRGNRWRPSK